MPMPPEFLRLKRKADDKETVELLYVQRENRDPRRSFTETRFKFQRISHTIHATTAPAGIHPQRSSSSDNVSRVPSVRTTLPGEENRSAEQAFTRENQDLRPPSEPELTTSKNASISNSKPISETNRPKLKPRVFHLTQDSISRSLQSRASTDNRAQKRDSRHPDHYPVFSERVSKQRPLKCVQGPSTSLHSNALAISPDDNMVLDSPNPPTHTSTPHKRPGATAAEKKWRAENWKSSPRSKVKPAAPQTEDQAADEQDYESLKLALEMQKFTLQHLGHTKPMESDQDKVSSRKRQAPIVRQQPLKFSPKSNPRRYTERHFTAVAPEAQTAVLDEWSDPPENDGEWVYDTYIRKPVTDGTDKDVGTADTPGVGLLVIPEEEQEIWDAYGEEEEELEKFDTDDEDENAEDYYGNDYPEDEMSSSDEFDRGAYTHRHAASDDEQRTWSEEEVLEEGSAWDGAL